MKKISEGPPWELIKKLLVGFQVILVVGLISYALLLALLIII